MGALTDVRYFLIAEAILTFCYEHGKESFLLNLFEVKLLFWMC